MSNPSMMRGQGRFEVETFSAELLVPVYRPAAESGRRTGDEAAVHAMPGRPIRTHAFPYLLLVGLLSGEWIGRRRRGLR